MPHEIWSNTNTSYLSHPGNRGTYCFWSVSTVPAAAALPTLFNFPGKPLKLISSNHTWLTCGCGKNFWHPFRWPLVKVTKRPKRNAINLVPTIKWEPLIQWLQNLVDISPSSCFPPKVLLLCRSWGACVPRRSQRLCQLEFWLLVGTTMLDRLWARGQTKCNTPLMLATSVFGRIHRRPCYVMAQPKSRLDIPWPNDAECMGHVWYHFSCWYPLLFDVESLAGCVGG